LICDVVKINNEDELLKNIKDNMDVKLFKNNNNESKKNVW